MGDLVLGTGARVGDMPAWSRVVAVAVCAALTLAGAGCGSDESTTTTTAGDGAIVSKSCGEFRLSGQRQVIVVKVSDGNVPCRVARQVVKDLYHDRDTGSWSCAGPESAVWCEANRGRHQGRILAGFRRNFE